jgi:hypothetical protein
VTFLLRIFYAGHLYQDDGLWFTAAEEVLRGKALYSDVYFDKPPGLPLVYALLFKLFGAHIITVRLFTIAYSVAVSWLLYRFGGWLYGWKAGLLAAAMFAVFSTTYTTGHVQGLTSDFLMLWPYTAGAYLLLRCTTGSRSRQSSVLRALSGGLLVGLAAQINPKALFALAFFGLVLILKRPGRDDSTPALVVSGWAPLGLALVGAALGSVLVLGPVASTGSLGAYWRYVWEWGGRYAAYYSAGDAVWTAVSQTGGYFLLNNTLLVALVLVGVSVVRRKRTTNYAPDEMVLLWFATSYAGVAVGGRFFGHYFLQIIPSLCLIGASGLSRVVAAFNSPAWQHRRFGRSALAAALTLGLVFTVVRFHGRTAVLALDCVRGTKSASTSAWFHERLNHEERMVAAVVSEMPDREEAAARVGLEAMRLDGPRYRPEEGPHDYLFVWGYRPEIYYWSGLLPASRFLSTQPLTGVPADVHYFGDGSRPLLDPGSTAQARNQLLRDLEQTRPKFIVDELGMFNSELSLEDFSEFREFMQQYKQFGTTGRFLVYRRRDLSGKRRVQDPERSSGR